MKPMSIEQVMALDVGDWLWVEDFTRNGGLYVRKCLRYCGEVFESRDYWVKPDYTKYGSTWIAYKNKEEAEAAGPIFAFPCDIGDKLFFINKYRPTMQIETFTVVGFELYKDAHEKLALRIFVRQHQYDRNYFDALNIDDTVFFDINKAQARLVEFRSKQDDT